MDSPVTVLLARMKYLFAIYPLLCISQVTLGQDRKVQLNIAVIERHSCATRPNRDLLALTLQLRYTNVGKEKLILYKGVRIFYQALVSRVDETLARKLEFRTSHAGYDDRNPEKLDTGSPGSMFTTLAPGATYETMKTIFVMVDRSGGARVNVAIGPGSHLVNLMVSTWYESRRLAELLRERWRGRGFLWTEPLTSNSVQFEVDDRVPEAVCR